jgi:glyoxylase I family protein
MAIIEHTALYAADTRRLRDFYADAFGLKVVFDSGTEPPAYFLADDRGAMLELIGRPADQSNAPQRWVCHIAFWVDDFSAARAALEQRGVSFEPDTAVENDTLRVAFFNDPEGNRCQIIWRKERLV